MIVTTGTGDRQPQNSLGCHVDLLVGEIEGELSRVALVQSFRPQRQETGGDQVFLPVIIVLYRQQVSGDLFTDELVIRLVGVE